MTEKEKDILRRLLDEARSLHCTVCQEFAVSESEHEEPPIFAEADKLLA